MIVTILGAHGNIARRLSRNLVERGDGVRGVVRDPEQVDDLVSDGAVPVICDLEAVGSGSLDGVLAGSDAVVFAAGAGPGSGPERKRTLDRDAAIAAVASAQRVGVGRFVIVSSMGADAPPGDDETFSVYLRAKHDADEAVRSSSIDHAIVRPGGLTDDDPTGAVTVGEHLDRGSVPRGDVAAVLAELVHRAGPIASTFELTSGDTPIPRAVASLR